MELQREALDMRLESIRNQALDAKAKAVAVIIQIDELGKWLDKQQLDHIPDVRKMV